MSGRIVSIVVPCRNERDHIANLCAAVRQQVLPQDWTIELVVADGESDDGTREWLEQHAASSPGLRLVPNPGRIVSTGLNAAIRAAQGEVIVRWDVHTRYADDYVAQCLATLERTGADNVGGPWQAQAAVPGTAMAQAIAASFQSRWVAGGARSRQLDYDGPVDTVYLGAWPCSVLERLGGFDENLVRNQDDELNLRLVRSGGRIWQSPRIRSQYQPRQRLSQVFRQYAQYGYWKPFVMKKHGQPASARHVVPALFVIALAFGVLCLPLSIVPLLLLLAAYGAAVLAMVVGVWFEQRPAWSVLWRVPAVIAAYHVAYGCGTVLGIADLGRGARPQSRFVDLTR